MGKDETQKLLSGAVAAARAAGDALKHHRGAWSRVEAEAGREVKVEADRLAEALILAALQTHSDYPILSEEIGWTGAQDADVFWAVDPLDGSVNYIKGYPHCAVSIALVRERAPEFGVVYNFLLDEMFVGACGQGATLNGAPIAVSLEADPAKAILQTGIPARARTEAGAFQDFMAGALRYRKVRMIGSAACALASVACGRAEAYREEGAMIWDVAGGLALVAAAGGRVRLLGDRLDAPLAVTADNGCIAA